MGQPSDELLALIRERAVGQTARAGIYTFAICNEEVKVWVQLANGKRMYFDTDLETKVKLFWALQGERQAVAPASVLPATRRRDYAQV